MTFSITSGELKMSCDPNSAKLSCNHTFAIYFDKELGWVCECTKCGTRGKLTKLHAHPVARNYLWQVIPVEWKVGKHKPSK